MDLLQNPGGMHHDSFIRTCSAENFCLPLTLSNHRIFWVIMLKWQGSLYQSLDLLTYPFLFWVPPRIDSLGGCPVNESESSLMVVNAIQKIQRYLSSTVPLSLLWAFVYLEMSLSPLSLLEGIRAGCRILGQQFCFSFGTLKLLLHTLLTFVVSNEKFGVILIFVPL